MESIPKIDTRKTETKTPSDASLPWPGGGLPPSEREERGYNKPAAIEFVARRQQPEVATEYEYIQTAITKIPELRLGEALDIIAPPRDSISALRYHIERLWPNLFCIAIVELDTHRFRIHFKGDPAFSGRRSHE